MKTILITGANRGLGLEFVNQLSARGDNVIATCRHPKKAEVLHDLAKKRKNISILTLDVSEDLSIANLVDELDGKGLDWVINNAGISGIPGVTIGNIDRENFLNVMNVNCVGALIVSEVLLPNLLKREDRLIINISSRMGSISDNQLGGSFAYRSSKAALNCAMHSFAVDVADAKVNVLLLHPGWVKTDLGGAQADIDAPTSVAGMLEVIEAHGMDSHAEALYSYDGKIVAW